VELGRHHGFLAHDRGEAPADAQLAPQGLGHDGQRSGHHDHVVGSLARPAAAAVAQLQVWGERLGIPVISAKQDADAAGLAYTAMEQARASGRDVLLVDTAGRLQNKAGLMDELAKVRRVLGKQAPGAPHDTILVLDATTGQNALNQIEIFREVAGVTGLVMTKLDGTARGGVLVAAAEKFGLPIHAIGVGEKLGDLRPFDPRAFAAALTGADR
jgi:fused signal recognition particle receptor